MQTDRRAKTGVVIQLNTTDPEIQERALRNAQNLSAQYESSALAVELVIYGPAVPLALPDHPLGNRLAELARGGIDILVCAIALRNQGVAESQLAEHVTTVPSAVVEIVERQLEGWAYLRP